jgi:phage shock protein A
MNVGGLIRCRRGEMGLVSRFTTVVKAKMSRLLDRAEDPRETLDYAYERQMETLRKVKQGLVEVVTARRRLEYQAEKVRQEVPKVEEQARQALALGREDLARVALQRKQAAAMQLEGLEEQIAGLEAEQERLSAAERRLNAKVTAFRTQKEVVKAQYTAAEASVKIGDALSGLSEEMSDIGSAMERTQTKIEQMRARSAALDELASVGLLEDFSTLQDPVGQELAKLTAEQNVERELAALKGQPPPAQPESLGPGNQGQ